MFETIERGVNFDRSLFTRKALKELRQKAAQDDGVACYYLGIYYLGPETSDWSKALAFFTKALGIAQKTGNTELEADARRKLLVIKIRDFFRKYTIPINKLDALQEDLLKEVSLIENLYNKELDHEGIVALLCDYGENMLPIYFAMLGVMNIAVGEGKPLTNPLPAEVEKEIIKSNSVLVKRVRHLSAMITKIKEIDRAMREQRKERCEECKVDGCAVRELSQPEKQSATG